MGDGEEEVVKGDESWGYVEDFFDEGGGGWEGVGGDLVDEGCEEVDSDDDVAIADLLVDGWWHFLEIKWLQLSFNYLG